MPASALTGRPQRPARLAARRGMHEDFREKVTGAHGDWAKVEAAESSKNVGGYNRELATKHKHL